jgi:hypothetical protein
MDRYQRVEKPRPETPINENEIRITTQGRMRNYITYATTLLQVQPPFLSLPLWNKLTLLVTIFVVSLLVTIFVETMPVLLDAPVFVILLKLWSFW